MLFTSSSTTPKKLQSPSSLGMGGKVLGGPACLEERQSMEEVREEASQAPCDQGGMASVPGCSHPVCWGGTRGDGREELLQPTPGAGQGPSRGRKGPGMGGELGYGLGLGPRGCSCANKDAAPGPEGAVPRG